jgi:hypothetical protein
LRVVSLFCFFLGMFLLLPNIFLWEFLYGVVALFIKRSESLFHKQSAMQTIESGYSACNVITELLMGHHKNG